MARKYTMTAAKLIQQAQRRLAKQQVQVSAELVNAAWARMNEYLADQGYRRFDAKPVPPPGLFGIAYSQDVEYSGNYMGLSRRAIPRKRSLEI